jgi:phage shock protein PspC (stress-responsive transcriptional regulator)
MVIVMVQNENQTETPRKQAAPAPNVSQAHHSAPYGGSNYQYGWQNQGGQRYHYHPYRKLYRTSNDKWLGGVCGGLAKYFNFDPLLVRLLWIIITLASAGVGIIGYILFWIFVKLEPTKYELSRQYVTKDEHGREHRHYHYQVS